MFRRVSRDLVISSEARTVLNRATTRPGRLLRRIEVPELTTESPAPAHFPTTHWSRIVAAGDPDAPQAQESLSALCDAYWYPLYAYVRRKGHSPAQAQDLTQDLFARILEKNIFATADPERGRFRSFLRSVCSHHLANRHEWANAQKRGAGRVVVPIDSLEAEGRYAREPAHMLTAEKIFDRVWALTLLNRVFDRLRREYHDAGKGEMFDECREVLTDGPLNSSYQAIAERLGSTEGAVRVAVHRLRQRYGFLLRQEIATTLNDPTEIDDEIHALFTALEL